jgi:hypothetical protein
MDLIITNDFCLPFERKTAGKNYLTKRVNNSRIYRKGKTEEVITIKEVMKKIIHKAYLY